VQLSPSHNLLIVSDLHLGADLKRTGFAWLRGVATLDREFGRFLEWYGEHPEGGRPWRLIVNGDMVDFINVTLLPEPGDPDAAFEVSDSERRFGLAGEEAKVAWMLGRIVARHRPLFEKLAAFLARGNEMAIVRGNHDVEFHWPAVQERFKALLSEIAGEDVAARISFLPWFYYEPGAIFVEHGHQYDEFSSFEYVLAPVSPGSPKRVDLPLSHWAIRYLANAFPGISTHDKDGWKLSDFLRWWWNEQGGGIGLLLGYVTTCLRLLKATYLRKLRSARDMRRAQARALEKLSEQWGLGVDLLRRLEKLHRGHAIRSAFRAAQCFYVDRFVMWGLGIAALPAIADSGFGLAPTLLGLAGWGGVLVGGDRLLASMRKSETPPKLKRAGRAVALLMNVPLVVMGHTHRPVEIGDETARYVNTGTWIPPKHAKAGFTHLMVKRGDSTLAELRTWNAAEARPFPLSEPS
jgi:UDP-2,3-diacylglucosamine pyrophosphatase LpxH